MGTSRFLSITRTEGEAGFLPFTPLAALTDNAERTCDFITRRFSHFDAVWRSCRDADFWSSLAGVLPFWSAAR